MEAKRINELANKIEAGKISREEMYEFELWYNTVDDIDFFIESDREKLSAKMFNSISSQAGIINEHPSAKRLWLNVITAAASIAIIIGIAFYISSRYIGYSNVSAELTVKYHILPGKNMAILKGPDGKNVLLNEKKKEVHFNGKEFRYSDGTKVDIQDINKTSNLSLYTPNGGTYAMVLPDGTSVVLNAGSQLLFPSSFDGSQRIVELIGEAYFEVAKDHIHPFIVKSSGQKVQVLGTHFNIRAYQNEKIKTTLLEGSVKILTDGLSTKTETANTTLLKPGQQAELDNSLLTVRNVNAETAVEWKNGDFVFEDLSFNEAMQSIARWYNVEVIFQGEYPEDIKIGGWISRKKNLNEVLKWISTTNNVHFKIKGRRILVSQ